MRRLEVDADDEELGGFYESLDRNQDGTLSKKEIKGALKGLKAEVKSYKKEEKGKQAEARRTRAVATTEQKTLRSEEATYAADRKEREENERKAKEDAAQKAARAKEEAQAAREAKAAREAEERRAFEARVEAKRERAKAGATPSGRVVEPPPSPGENASKMGKTLELKALARRAGVPFEQVAHLLD